MGREDAAKASSRFAFTAPEGEAHKERGARKHDDRVPIVSLIIFETEVDGVSETSLARFLAKTRREVGLPGKVNIVVTTNDAIRDLNRRFRKKNKPTDVLSFPAGDEFQSEIAGDIVISAEIAAENAVKLGHPFSTELKVLLLHGVLHLAGYDHEDDDGRMERTERKLRKAMRLPDGLIERTMLSADNGAKLRASRPRKSRPPAAATKARRS